MAKGAINCHALDTNAGARKSKRGVGLRSAGFPTEAQRRVAARTRQVLRKYFRQHNPYRIGHACRAIVADRSIFEVLLIVRGDGDVTRQEFFIRNKAKAGTSDDNSYGAGSPSTQSIGRLPHCAIPMVCEDFQASSKRTACGRPNVRSNRPKMM